MDSLTAIKKLVYDQKTMPLDNLTAILKSDWKDSEVLRLTVKRKFPKFGLNEKYTDETAKDIADVMYRAIGGKPNVKGGPGGRPPRTGRSRRRGCNPPGPDYW